MTDASHGDPLAVAFKVAINRVQPDICNLCTRATIFYCGRGQVAVYRLNRSSELVVCVMEVQP